MLCWCRAIVLLNSIAPKSNFITLNGCVWCVRWRLTNWLTDWLGLPSIDCAYRFLCADFLNTANSKRVKFSNPKSKERWKDLYLPKWYENNTREELHNPFLPQPSQPRVSISPHAHLSIANIIIMPRCYALSDVWTKWGTENETRRGLWHSKGELMAGVVAVEVFVLLVV